jgi:hypothetical protein
MSEVPFATSTKVLARVGALLGIDLADPLALAAAVTLVVPPALSVGDVVRLDGKIGLPSDLMTSLQTWALTDEAPVPLVLIPLIVRATLLYALAVETFGDENYADKWWGRPMTLLVEHSERSPREWSSHAAAAAELVSRMRRTLTGVM